MVHNLEQIKEVAQNENHARDIQVFLLGLQAKNAEDALHVAKTIFFDPRTHPKVRYKIAEVLGRFKNGQLFHQILSYFILKSFPDRIALICALKNFVNPEATPALTEYYGEASHKERLEIIEALANIQVPETIEFLSQIYNQQITYHPPPTPQEIQALRQSASSALSKSLMRFDLI